MAQQAGILDALRAGHHHIAEADIDLQGDPGPAKPPLEQHADTGVVGVLFDALRADRRGQELQPVGINLECAQIRRDGGEILRRVLGASQQIHIARGTRRGRVPRAAAERP
jgi:hypothetical protein